MDVFSRYLFAVPLSTASAQAVAQALVNIFLRHSYIPRLILTDLGTVFTSNLFKELTQLLQVKLKHASLKHAQTIGLLERSHAALKRTLRINENGTSPNWVKYVDIAVFVHNTSYHTSIGCTPSLLFHGREPITPIDIRFQTSRKTLPSNDYMLITSLHSRMSELFSTAKENIIRSYQKYKCYYDRKCAATPLELHSYCLLLDPKIVESNKHLDKTQLKWLSLYRVEKVLSNNNYIVRKVGTYLTQCVHRIRLRPIKPKYIIQDIDPLEANMFLPDTSLLETHREPNLFDRVLANAEEHL